MTPARFIGLLLVFAISASTSQAADELNDAELFVIDSETGVTSAAYDDSHADSGNSCCKPDLFGGLVKPSQSGFDRFITPITNSVFFEDPRTLTEARVLFIQHKVPLAAGGNDVQVAAMQMRFALSDRLSIVAAKDGYIFSQNPLIDDGWADVAAGLKYQLLADEASQRLLSAGVSIEMPVGSQRSLQGNGDGEFHLYMTGARMLGCHTQWVSASGVRLPSNPAQESRSMYWSNHFSRRISDSFYLLTEFHWFHWTGSGQQAGLAGVEGGDLFNLGSTGVTGDNIVTGAFGMKFKPCAGREIGIAWELPLTRRRYLLENRLTIDWVFRY